MEDPEIKAPLLSARSVAITRPLSRISPPPVWSHLAARLVVNNRPFGRK